MATINSTIKMQDKASSTLDNVQNNMSGIVQKANQVNSSTSTMGSKIKLLPSEIQKAQMKYDSLAASQDKVNAKIDNIASKQKKIISLANNYNGGWLKALFTSARLNIKMAALERSKQKLIDKSNKYTATIIQQENEMNKLKGIVDKVKTPDFDDTDKGSDSGGIMQKMMYLNQSIELIKKGAQALKGAFDYADTLTQNKARLDLINDGLNTTAEMQTMIYEAANRSRGSYQDMASSVAKLGLLAGDSFKGNKEIVAFTELLNKSFVVAGAGAQEASSAMYQLTQAMASGKLQGDEFRSIMENAPMLADAIAKYTGKTKGELKEMSSEGKITSDIIKNAMFMAADDINGKFEKMPMTFAQAGTKIKNAWDLSMQGMADKLTEVLNSEQVQTFLNYLIIGIQNLGAIVVPIISTIINIISSIVNFIVTNWPTISQVLILVGMVLLPMILSALWSVISALVVAGAQAVLAGIKMFVSWMMTLGPIGLIIMAIIAVMAILKMLGVSFETIFGIIGGILGTFVAFVFNFVILPVWNKFAAFANFLGNVFNDPVYSIKKLFVDLLNTVLDIVNSVAKVIDKVLGTKWSSSIKGFQKDMKNWLGESDKYKEYVPELEAMDFENAWNTGQSIGGSLGKGLDNMISSAGGLFDNLQNSMSGLQDQFDLSDVTSNGAVNSYVDGGTLDEVNISDEDLKLLKDIANREYMVNYKQITPNVNVKFGDVRETADVNKLKDAIETMMKDELGELYVVEEG